MINGMLLQQRIDSFLNTRLWTGKQDWDTAVTECGEKRRYRPAERKEVLRAARHNIVQYLGR